jgi:hypothetical protein
MFDSIKLKIAHLIVNKQAEHNYIEKRLFKDFLKGSFKFLILMPISEVSFNKALVVLNFFERLNKEIVVFTQDFRINLIPQKYRSEAVDFSLNDINKLKLPSQRLREKFVRSEFDIVMDLEKEENLFNSLLVCYVNAPVKIGFKKNNSDKFYNLQIDNIEDNPEIFYKNLLNFLQMF